MATKRKSKKKIADTREITAAASRDLFEVINGNSVPNPDAVVTKESAGKGLKLYEEMEDKDGHIASVIQTRKLALVGREWEVLPATESREDKKKAEFVRTVFEGLGFDNARKDQLDGLMKGFAVSEIMFELSEGDIWIREFRHRKPWRFVFGRENELRLLTEDNSIDGEEVPEDKFWVFTFNGRYGNRYGKPLGQKLYWPYWFKKNNIRWWAIFNEKFGSPTATGKYRPGTKKDDQDKLLDVLKSIQQETGIVLPDDMAIELLEASRRGSFETYSTFIQWTESLESKIVLGQTLTTEQGNVGSLSLGQVHDEVRQEILKADADDLCESLNNGPVKILVDLNFPKTTNYPKIWVRTDREKDLKPQADRDKTIFDMGYQPKQDYIEETYSIDVDPIPIQTPASGPQFAEALDGDTVGPFVERLLREADMGALAKPAKDLLVKSESLTEFRDGLINLVPKIDVVEVGNLMQKALSASELAGRWDALPEEEKK